MDLVVMSWQLVRFPLFNITLLEPGKSDLPDEDKQEEINIATDPKTAFEIWSWHKASTPVSLCVTNNPI
jgi:hypothetical protein